jgi:hypothetical protein
VTRSASTSDPDNVGDYLISARSFEEYVAMFGLTDEDLRGSVLDCPGGGSSFTAGAGARGACAIAADPIYDMPTAALQRLVLDEADRGTAHTAAGSDRYCWDFFGDLEGHRRQRRGSAVVFADDLATRPDRYVAASLPALPFDDGTFDVVLSSHFLFTYADRLSLDTHLHALQELSRVGTGDVRIFPLLDQGGRSIAPLLTVLVDRLGRVGIATEVRTMTYEFQRGGNQMLRLSAR